ncbi:dual specificity protein phosphatase 13-like isoform X1 [Brienomyrus brachyistius]|uniref:dual specificity protein phosphatase 13-like isoform X1 n=1 Tax=Brienomyrus brachyistius TaxID=42636 RepID=UPI0020B29188|nr:dual specificity protein phosphatase 13-like isoform X1 [Brienomyrus brachyistius]
MDLKESRSNQEGNKYETPPIPDLLHLLLKGRHPTGPVNEVWPGVYIGNASTARDKELLLHLGITHIVNAASGPEHIDTGPTFYSDLAVTYYGVEAADHRDFDLTPFFYPTARFMREALSQKGRVFVHCARGISRSAALVLAFLMISEKLTLAEAIKAVRQHRNILPNAGFLSQLHHLDQKLAPMKSQQDS